MTFWVSLIGYYLGKTIGDRFSLKLEVFGGLVLVGIGVKILYEHLLAA